MEFLFVLIFCVACIFVISPIFSLAAISYSYVFLEIEKEREEFDII